jgi:predicted DNA-binding antitoxin AbrB/MazE fold protein
MTITVDAVFRNGQLEFKEPVQLAEGTPVRVEITPVRVEITPVDEDDDPLEAVIGIGDSGRTDGAEQHDHYIYGTPKR